MSEAKINWDADLHPSKSKDLWKTTIVFPEWLSGSHPDIYRHPCLLLIHK